MAQDSLGILIRATKERRCVALRVGGEGPLRVIEPHVIYLDLEGIAVVECFQTKGPVAEGEMLPAWQALPLKRIESVFLLNTEFRARVEEGFEPDKVQGLNNLIAVVKDPLATLGKKRAEAAGAPLLTQARALWGHVGSAIDRALAADDRPPRGH